jgi:hypothetical protein
MFLCVTAFAKYNLVYRLCSLVNCGWQPLNAAWARVVMLNYKREDVLLLCSQGGCKGYVMIICYVQFLALAV